MGQAYLCAYGGEFLANNCPINYGYIFLVLISWEKRGGKGHAPFYSIIYDVCFKYATGIQNAI